MELPPGRAQRLKASRNRPGEWHGGKSRRQEALINHRRRPLWVSDRRLTALGGDTWGPQNAHPKQTSNKNAMHRMSHISQTTDSQTLGFIELGSVEGNDYPDTS